MIKMKKGTTRIGSNVVSPADGAFCTDKETEMHLVALGVAEFVDTQVATPPKDTKASGTGDDKAISKDLTVGEIDGDVSTFEYSFDSSVSELRKIGKECGIKFKIGLTKEEMVKALDEYFADAPNLSAADPIE